MGLEERVARIEGIIEQIEKRLNHIESEMIRDIRNEIREVRKDLNYRFYWLLGVQIAILIAIISPFLQTVALSRDITIPVLVIAITILVLMSMGILRKKR
jgi:hypothetical protein